MKKYLLTLVLFITIFFFDIKDASAFSSNDYKNRGLCGNYEIANFKADGNVVSSSCHATYNEARDKLKANNDIEQAIMTKVNGETKIVDATSALLDLSVNPETLTYFYEDAETNGRKYTYMDTGSLYGGVDGAHIDTYYSNSHGWNAKVKIANFTGWIRETTYEIVPITWVKSSSSYTITNDSIHHNYADKIQNSYNDGSGRTIGPKPEMLEAGTYYSYDGHYFYKDLKTLIADYKAGNYNNSVNKDKPYYNYYMHLSNHTRTNYSSLNIDEYIRDTLGYKEETFGTNAYGGTSKLYGMGTFFYHAQETYGVNAILALSLSRNETSNGRSNLAINKNNGFGLNAVDSSPTESANWYATFSSSILGFANKWITYGYNHPRDWRYFGPQYGDKLNGMNVKYASDTYWSEKMASNYYALDRAKGMQDYDYYQLGVVTRPVDTRSKPDTNSKFVYSYPESGDALVIIGEEKGTPVEGNDLWYKIVSDLNINSNFDEITSGYYNWNSYVYVPAAYVQKINKGKAPYKSPNDVTEYEDKNYSYDLQVENTNFIPIMGMSLENTSYHFDPTLTQKTNDTLMKDRYVIIYAKAYDENKKLKSLLVTSDYWHNQKHWVDADKIKQVSGEYGKVVVDHPSGNNYYTYVNSDRTEKESTKIGGLYTYGIVPILEHKMDGGREWLKVPVNLKGNNNLYGWTLASSTSEGIKITSYKTTAKNNPPVINAEDVVIIEGRDFDERKNVTAFDIEDKDLTKEIKIVENNVNKEVVGVYKVKYQVTDSYKETTIKEIKVTVIKDELPVINANNKETYINQKIDLLKDVTAVDKEDGKLTNIKVNDSLVNYSKKGNYKVYYEVLDSRGHKVVKEITLTVRDKELMQKKGEFYLNSLTWNNNSKKYEISGYMIILNSHNKTKSPKYTLVLEDKNTKEKHEKTIKPWFDNVPYELGTENGYDYNISWFKDSFDLEDIPSGDYNLYMKTVKDDNYALEEVNNLFNKDIKRRAEHNNTSYNFKVELGLKSQKIDLYLRHDKSITTNEAPTFRNMINNYDNITFVDNKLRLVGTSYNYGASYDKNVARELILENTKTFKRYKYDLSSTNKGSYQVTSSDKLSKEFAWYDKTIDISNLEPGTYSMIVHTTAPKADDYGEINDIFGHINEEEKIIGDKHYKISLNKERTNRIELIVLNK